MNVHPTADELVAYYSGKLPSERSRQVDAHLDTCDVCRALTDKRPPVPVLPRRASPHPAVPEGYKFVEELGRGGMGVVYLATRLSDGAQVVIKTLLPDHRGNSKLAGYLEREAALTAKVHSIRVLSGAQLRPFSPTDPTPYIEFPWVPSTPMGKMIGTPLAFESIPRLVGWVIQCCRALEAAHQRSPAIVHFDLKPENVLIQNQDSEAVLIDFGLACEWPPPNGETRTGCGTYEYMAPEVADPGRSSLIGTQTDVFALGGMLCAILTGKPPYARTDFQNSKNAVLEAARKANLKPAFDRLDACHEHLELVAFTKRCLSVEPANRPRDARAVRVELERLVRTRRSRGRWMAWPAALAIVVAALTALQLAGPDRDSGGKPELLFEATGWRHGAYGRLQGGNFTYGLVGPENSQEDVIYSYPLVKIPKPYLVKSIQLKRRLGAVEEDVTFIIDGKDLEVVAKWGGTVPTGEALQQGKDQGRRVNVQPNPRKPGEDMTSGGNPFDNPNMSQPHLRASYKPFENDRTTIKRISAHKEALAKYEYWWLVKYADDRSETVSLKDKGPSTAEK